MDKISVLLPTYNRGNFISESIESLLNQTFPPHEIIVIDDGSTDNTYEVVTSYGKPVRYVYKPNGGKSSALNLVIPEVEGDYVWIFDDDDVALPHANEIRLEAFKQHPNVGMVFGSRIIGATKSNGKLSQIRKESLDLADGPEGFCQLLLGNYFFLSSALIKTKVMLKTGPFNENLFRGQDYEYLLRLTRSFDFFNCKSYLYVFRDHDGVRGAAVNRHSAAERTSMHLKYDQSIGRWIRSQFVLNDYIPNGRRGSLRQQLISRAVVMASKGLRGEMLQDLHRLLELDPLKKFDSNERKYARKFTEFNNFWVAVKGEGFITDLFHLPGNPASRSLIREISKSYYWAMNSKQEDAPPKIVLFFSAISLYFYSIKPW